ncbi:MAG: DNA repair protein Rad52 [Turneriella sp.]|nr:DNA repair protein Rad52 [Turneriella sp.]
MNENEKTPMARLTAPFKPEEIKWRATLSGLKDGKPWVMVAPYLDARTIQDRLDNVLGADCWTAKYRQGPGSGILCTLSIRINGEWIDKCDAASLTEIEPVKGGISNAFRRASVAWGIGRYLYNIGNAYGFIHERGQYKGSAKDKVNNSWINFRWNPPKLEVESSAKPQNESKPAYQPKPTAASGTTSTTPTTLTTSPRVAGTQVPTYEELPMSLKQIFQQVKISQTKALDMVRRKNFDYVAVEKLLRELMPDIEKKVAA